MCDDKYISELNKMRADISEFENKLISDYNLERENREQKHKQMLFKTLIIKGFISYFNHNKSTKKNIRYVIPFGFNESIIKDILDNYLNNNLITLQFVNIDSITSLPQSFDICWDDDDNLLQYLLSS